MGLDVSDARFDELVEHAIGQIPSEILDQVENCVVLVEGEPGPEYGDVLGFYDGTPLSERSSNYSGVLPDRILIFRGPLCRMVNSDAELVEEIRITVWHELAHYFGIEDDELDDWGYA